MLYARLELFLFLVFLHNKKSIGWREWNWLHSLFIQYSWDFSCFINWFRYFQATTFQAQKWKTIYWKTAVNNSYLALPAWYLFPPQQRNVEYIFRIFFVCVMFFWHWCYKNLKHHRISTLWFILSSFRKHVQHSKAYHVEFDTEKMAKHLKIITTLKSLKQTLMVIYRLYPFTELLNDRIDPKLRHAINILFFHLKNRIAQVYRK